MLCGCRRVQNASSGVRTSLCDNPTRILTGGVAGIEKGPIFRRVLANGRVGKDALTERAVWQLVREYAAQIGIGELAPHDLRRTAAKLCRSKGGELEQIQFLLGHESILTTERYLGSEQDLKNAVNDALVFE